MMKIKNERAKRFEIPDIFMIQLLTMMRVCKTIKHTRKLAREFAALLRKRGRAIVCFNAEMGAGKTTFIREVVKALGVRNTAASPTFSIINKYTSSVFHIDLYRLEDVTELLNTDFHEIIAGNNFVFIEWSEKFEIDYPPDSIKIKIQVEEDGSRVFNITN